MPKKPMAVFTLGILVVIIALSMAAFAANILVGLFEVFSLTVILFGLWIVILAMLRVVNPDDFGAGAFGTFSGGVLITTLGSVWLLYIRAQFVGYLLPALLLVVGILVAIVGIRAWQRLRAL